MADRISREPLRELKPSIIKRLTTVGKRITYTAGFLILLSVATGYVAYQASIDYRSDAQTVTTLAKRTIKIFETDLFIYKLVRAEKDFVLTAQDEFKNERIAFSNKVDEGLEVLIASAVTAESRQLLEELKSRKEDYDKNFVNAVQIFANSKNQAMPEATTSVAILQAAFEEVKSLSLTNTEILINAESDIISKIVELDVGRIEATLEKAIINSEQVRIIALAAMFSAIVIGILVAFFVIRAITKALRNIVERLVRLTNVLRDSVGQATDVANRNATTANQLAASSDQQAKQVEEITTTITQTASAITGSADLAREGSTSANQVTSLATEGGKNAEKANASLVKISQVVVDAVGRIKTLAANSREVGELAGEVTSIADQTNILALNAAIEAARAGEAGRGFAVVADEVRRLAESSRKFADQITQLINSVVEQAQETAANTADGAKEIESSTTIITESLNSFKQIAAGVTDANKKIQDIASSVSQQAQSAEQISSTATSISKGIEQNTGGARNLADAVDQQKVVINVIEKSLEEAQSILLESRSLVGLSISTIEDEAEMSDDAEMNEASVVNVKVPDKTEMISIKEKKEEINEDEIDDKTKGSNENKTSKEKYEKK